MICASLQMNCDWGTPPSKRQEEQTYQYLLTTVTRQYKLQYIYRTIIVVYPFVGNAYIYQNLSVQSTATVATFALVFNTLL